MYEVYFCWNEYLKIKPLWHPINLPQLTDDEAKKIATALKTALPTKRFAYGPKFGNGVKEIIHEHETRNY